MGLMAIPEFVMNNLYLTALLTSRKSGRRRKSRPSERSVPLLLTQAAHTPRHKKKAGTWQSPKSYFLAVV